MMHPGKARAEGRTVRLASQMVELANPGQLLPTPNSGDIGRGNQHPDKRRAGGHQVSLGSVAEFHLLPTPLANEGEKAWFGKRESEGQKYLSHVLGEQDDGHSEEGYCSCQPQ